MASLRQSSTPSVTQLVRPLGSGLRKEIDAAVVAQRDPLGDPVKKWSRFVLAEEVAAL